MTKLNWVDVLIDTLNTPSLALQLRDKVALADNADRRQCGNCQHWMATRTCPREVRDGNTGRYRGPSTGEPACSKFALKSSAAALKARRVEEAVAFAKEHNLPVPPTLAQNGAN